MLLSSGLMARAPGGALQLSCTGSGVSATSNGGKELAGCGGGMPGFATRERLAQSSMEASWVPDETHYVRRGETVPATSGR